MRKPPTLRRQVTWRLRIRTGARGMGGLQGNRLEDGEDEVGKRG